MDWQFSTISLQYIMGGALSFIITIYLLCKNVKTSEFTLFFLYGLFTSIWMFFIFLHRNAPTAELSGLCFKVAMFSLHLQLAFLLITILNIRRSSKIYLLCMTPAVIIGIFEFGSPIEIFSGRWGWAYKYLSGFINISVISRIVHALVSCFILLIFIKKQRIHAVQKKYKVILCGLILYLLGMVSTNAIISSHPNFPPFGGVFTTMFFLFIAYAISLPTEIISANTVLPSGELPKSYLQFLNSFRNVIPGKELGSGSFRFEEYLEAMGLKDIVVPESGKLTFALEKIDDENMSEILDSILRIIKEYSWAMGAVNDFTDVFLNTYKTLKLKSKDAADKWFEQMVRIHGGFLSKQGILADIPEDVKIPAIFKELSPGKSDLFSEETPNEAYSKLKEALDSSFDGLVITKFHPQKVIERYNIEKASIFWLTFNELKTSGLSNDLGRVAYQDQYQNQRRRIETENKIDPKNLNRFSKAISDFVKSPSRSVVLLDCFKEIVLVNGFEYAMNFLREIKEICKECNANLLISINPKVFEEKQIPTIEKELEELK